MQIRRRHTPGLSPATILRCLLSAALLTALVLTLASVSLFVTSAPAAISLMVEPFSLLLLPGLLMTIATTGSHDDISQSTILLASAALYFIVFCALLWHRRPHPARSR